MKVSRISSPSTKSTTTTTTTVTKKSQLLAALQKGEKLTAAEIGVRFNIGNPTAMISRLRYDGFVVEPTKNGRVTTYSNCAAPRELIIAGYRARQFGLV